MPLRPDFHHWLDIVTEYKYHGELRRMFPIRATDGFNPLSKEQWDAMCRRLPERLAETSMELEAIQGTLQLFWKKRQTLEKIGEILFLKENKPFFILENTTMYSSSNTVCCVVHLDTLVTHGCITKMQQETLNIENARWKIIRAAGVYVILCAAATWLGDLRGANI